MRPTHPRAAGRVLILLAALCILAPPATAARLLPDVSLALPLLGGSSSGSGGGSDEGSATTGDASSSTRSSRLSSAVPTLSVAAAQAGPAEASKSVDVSITKTDSPDPAVVGGTITYTLTVRNDGPDRATGVKVVDDLPAGVTFVNASAGCRLVSGNVECSPGSLNVGASATLLINVTASEPGNYTNVATVSANDPDPDASDNSASATTSVVTAPPGGVTCTVGEGSITVSWDAVEDATGYNVYRATGSDGFLLLASTTSTSYRDDTVAVGQVYRYYVAATSAGGASSPSETCTSTAIPLFPTLLAGAAATLGGVAALRWMRRR